MSKKYSHLRATTRGDVPHSWTIDRSLCLVHDVEA